MSMRTVWLLIALLVPYSLGLEATSRRSLWQFAVALQQSTPLRFLPRAGCLALKVRCDNNYSYHVVVDTGSPFLTAPDDQALKRQTRVTTKTTTEQYGQQVADLEWRQCWGVVWLGEAVRIPSATIGLVPSQLQEATGGLFCGLMSRDDHWPTVLEQSGYRSVVVDYAERRLEWHRGRILVDGDDRVLPLTDLNAYGPNLYHYAIQCESVVFRTRKGDRVHRDSWSRPVAVVIDTGLTGCILSDSWREDLDDPEELTGATLSFGSTLTLDSDPTYWNASCFRLPWFPDDKNHPHILAAGGTFLQNRRIELDPGSKLLRIS